MAFPLSMTVGDPVSDAISFRLATIFEKTAQELYVYITDNARRGCECGSESVRSDDHINPVFSNLPFSCLRQESVGASQQVLSSQIVHVNIFPCPSHPSDGLGLKREDAYWQIVILDRVIWISASSKKSFVNWRCL